MKVTETEASVSQLPELLENLLNQPEQLKRMQDAGRELWNLYAKQGPVTILGELSRLDVVRSRVNLS